MLQEASSSGDLPALSAKEEAIMYLKGVEQVLDTMADEARDLTAQADRDLADIGKAADTPAAQLIALHKFCGSLLTSLRDNPQKLTAQAEAVQNVMKASEKLSQYIEEVRKEFHTRVASCEERAEAAILEMQSLDDRIDEWMEPKYRILLGEAAYSLALLAEEHVFGRQGSRYEHDLTLNQLHSMYTASQLDREQARRWEQVKAFVDSRVDMAELLIVDSELRKARYGDAHGTAEEKHDTSLEDLMEFAARLYGKNPDLHGPLQKMLTILAEFSSKDTPCVPDRTFASKMHRSLLPKTFS